MTTIKSKTRTKTKIRAIRIVGFSLTLVFVYYVILIYNYFSGKDEDLASSALTLGYTPPMSEATNRERGEDLILSIPETKRIVIPKVLIYIATHMPSQHKEYLKHCWPLALKNSYLLNTSDVAVYLTPEEEEIDESVQILKETFKKQNLTYYINKNLGYQAGALAALTQGSNNHWFDGYDWVIRMNPDVIIQNDTWMLDTIENDVNASLLYIDCFKRPKSALFRNNVRLVHTDFFALKISELSIDHLNAQSYFDTVIAAKKITAETMFTERMGLIIEKEQHRHVPDSYPKSFGICRVDGNRDGAVFHFPSVNLQNGICPAKFFN